MGQFLERPNPDDDVSLMDPADLAALGRRRREGFERDASKVAAALQGTLWSGRSGAWLLPRLDATTAKDVGPALAQVLPELRCGQVVSNVVGAFGRAAGTPWAADLLAQFQLPFDGVTRWDIGSAVFGMSPRKLAPVERDIIQIVNCRAYGRSREMLAMVLPRIGTETATAAALELLVDDPEISGHVLSGLARAKAAVPATLVLPFLEHPRSDVRRDAKRLLG